MLRLRDIKIQGERVFCENCKTVFTEALRGPNDGKECPKCSGKLRIRFIQDKYSDYEVDTRYF